MGEPPDASRLLPAFLRFCEIIAKLRSPEGCPWDRVQTLETIKPYTLEETYELLEAIDAGDDAAIVEELGDLLLQVVLDAQIGADEGRFDLIDVLKVVSEKMVRRHPHVFGETQAETKEDVSRNWDKIKQAEKSRESILDGIPKALPQLARAARITKKAARVGYDFPHRDMLFDKLREEIAELAAELFEDGRVPEMSATVEASITPDQPVTDPVKLSRIESEIGDILFVIANIARRWGVNPEEALRHSNEKFTLRFQYIEKQLAAQGKTIADVTLIEMEELYQKGKKQEPRTQ
jgi:MazG family protein